ncbi:dTDP-4-dehydrorhamnose reductase [bacterium]|nr:MAG: dTDP-4-dehydrorhamnose reductase [bacterium]
MALWDRVAIVGSRGQLGTDLMAAFADLAPLALDRPAFDLENPASMAALLAQHRPTLVINTAAFHDVERCESEPALAFAVNALGVDALAEACRNAGAALMHVSTDYVFDGAARAPYPESAPPSPLSVYAISKVAGERLIARHGGTWFVVRTCGLYGVAGSRVKGTTFAETMLRKARAGEALRVVDDQTVAPSYTRDVAGAMRAIARSERPGIYHVTNAGACSWYEFAAEIFRQAGIAANLTPVSSAQFPTRARRPAYSLLANEGLHEIGYSMPTWQAGLRAYLQAKGLLGAPAPAS